MVCKLLFAFLVPVASLQPGPMTDAYCTPGSVCWPLKAIRELEESLSPSGQLIGGTQGLLAFYLLCHTPGAFNASQRAGHSAPALNPEYCGPLLSTNVSDVAQMGAGLALASSYTLSGLSYKSPGFIVIAHSSNDVLNTVDFARSNNVKLAVRNTGHAYNGQSSAEGGVVLDISNLADVTVDEKVGTLTCGGGATWGPVYKAANDVGFVVVGGHDPTVGVVGCMLGACHGEFSRMYGYSADNIVEMQVVILEQEARVVTVSSSSNPELFYAMRGGGPGFGVVLSVTMNMHAAPPAQHVFYTQTDPNDPAPLCPGLAAAKNASLWWLQNGASTLKKVVFNASWWDALPRSWSGYGSECSISLIYSGLNLEEDLKVPAIQALEALMGSAMWEGETYSTQSDMHIAQADTINYLFQPGFTSFVPAADEISNVADVLANMHADGEITGVFYNGVLGGRASQHVDNAVGAVLRQAVGLEITLNGCQSDACKEKMYALGSSDLDGVALLFGETLQAAVDKLEPVVWGKYVNEFTSKAGYALPQTSQFWDPVTYENLLNIKNSVDPCNVLNVEVGVGWDLPHCKAVKRDHILV